MFANDDVEINKGALEKMVKWLKEPNVGQVGRKLRVGIEKNQLIS